MIIDEMFNIGCAFARKIIASTCGDAICDAWGAFLAMKHDILVEITSTNAGTRETELTVPITFIKKGVEFVETASIVSTNLFAVEEGYDGT
jgi:hypothetical protein